MQPRRKFSKHAKRSLVAALLGVAVVAIVATAAMAVLPKPQTGSRPTPNIPKPSTGLLTSWPMFGLDAQHSGATNQPTGITKSLLGSLTRLQVHTPGTIDSEPIISHDTAFATTTYGKTIAVNLNTGAILWTFTPSSYGDLAGSPQITSTSPALDPTSHYVFAASPDGDIHKLDAATGVEQAGWPVSVTEDATHERLASAITVSQGRVIVGTAGYIGDIPPYQGKVVTIDATSGNLDGVFNVLCSDRHSLFDPSTCPKTDGGVWASAGVVVQPGTGDLYVATSNGGFDGVDNWGDSVLKLSPDATALISHWTPSDQLADDQEDIDVGSTSPAVVGAGLLLQGGKDAKLHLLDATHLAAVTGTDAQRLGGDLQILSSPAKLRLFSQPAVWDDNGKTVVIVATGSDAAAGSTVAYVVKNNRLAKLWSNTRAGTSPAVAGGLLYVYDPVSGVIRVDNPSTGAQLKTLAVGAGHFTSVAIANGHVVVGQGNPHTHSTTGILTIWSAPR